MVDRISAATLDFTNVKDGGAMFTKKHRPIGDYRAKVTKVTEEKSKSDQTPMWLYTIELVDFPNSTYPYYCKLQDNQLWKVRNLFQAAGIAIPKKRVKLDPSRVVGKLIGVTLEEEEYEGKMQSTVDAIIPVTEVDGKVEAEEPDDVEDDEEGDEEELRYSDDRDGLKAFIRAKGLEIPIKKSMSDDDIRDAIDAALASTDDDEDEEEDEEPPAPKKKKAKKPAEDELDELDLDDL